MLNAIVQVSVPRHSFLFRPSHEYFPVGSGPSELVVQLRTNRNGLVLLGREDGTTFWSYPVNIYEL